MSENTLEITCIRCRRAWHADLNDESSVELVIYRGKGEPTTYRVRCSQCGTYNQITVVEEDENG